MAQLAKIETAKVPATATAAAGLPAPAKSDNVIPLQTEDVAYQRLGLIVLVVVFGIFAVWAGVAPLGSHAMATGRIEVQMKKQIIQHREGGVVQDIFVDDGDHVEKGQKLMVINPTEAQTDKGMVYEQFLGYLGLEARLNAQLEGKSTVNFPAELINPTQAKERAAEILADERQQFKVEMAAVSAESGVLKQRIQQLKEQMAGTEKQIQSQRNLANAYAKDHQNLQDLFNRKLIGNQELNQMERGVLSVNSDIAELETAKSSLKVQMGEAEQQLVLQNNNRKKEMADRLAQVRLNIADLKNRLNAVTDRLSRTTIVAPENGTVIGMEYHTKGGVVPPGGKIMEIVPKIDGFEVEAQVDISDIDKVHVGLEADIRFPAFSSSSFMKVTPGEVIQVSADTFSNPNNGAQFYKARIKIKPEGIAELAKHKLELVQGMPTEVAIKTGERTFLTYLMKPVNNMVNHALNED